MSDSQATQTQQPQQQQQQQQSQQSQQQQSQTSPGQHLGPNQSANPHNHDAVVKLFDDYGKPLHLTIEEALIRVAHKNNFYATVASGLSRRAVNSAVCPTLAVVVNPDTALGVELIYCPEYFSQIQSLAHFEFVLEHELVHLVLKHPQRFWEHQLSDTLLSTQTFNIAADFADNSLIVKHFNKNAAHLRKLYLFPESQSLPPEMSFEFYLNKLHNELTEDQLQQMMQKAVNKHDWDSKLNSDGELVPADSKDISQAAVHNELHFDEFIQSQITRHERNHGALPGYVRELLKDIIKPNVIPNWDDLLKAEVMSGMPTNRERSILRFSRRKTGIPQACQFPGMKTEQGYTIVFVQDTSGSISNTDLQVAAGIVSSLKEHRHAVEVHYVQADTNVVFHKKIRDMSDFEWEAHGRGGTDFCSPLEWVHENIRPDIVLYFTDGYGRAPTQAPPFKVVWILPEGCRAPSGWGRSVTVNYNQGY